MYVSLLQRCMGCIALAAVIAIDHALRDPIGAIVVYAIDVSCECLNCSYTL